MSKLFFENESLWQMERFLDLAVERQALIASNLANIDTPNYKTVDVDFEAVLQSTMGGQGLGLAVTSGRHISQKVDGQGRVVGAVRRVEGLPLRQDLNNVNIDREMSRLSINTLKFSMVSQMIGGRLRSLKSVITEGR